MRVAAPIIGVFLLGAGYAFAGPGAGEPKDSTDPASGRPGTVLDDAKCASVWTLTEREGDTLSEAKATPFVVNFKLVDANADGKISEAEFKDGCKKGLVQAAAAEDAPEPSEAMAPQDEEQPASPAAATDALEKEVPPAAAAAAAAAQENTEFVTSVPADALSISTYYNEDVYDNQDNKIGDVNDILLDKDGRVSTVIIGVGGFLGVGEKDVAVPFSALKVAEKEGDRYLVINTTKEALEKAPGYIYDKDKGVWVPATKEG